MLKFIINFREGHAILRDIRGELIALYNPSMITSVNKLAKTLDIIHENNKKCDYYAITQKPPDTALNLRLYQVQGELGPHIIFSTNVSDQDFQKFLDGKHTILNTPNICERIGYVSYSKNCGIVFEEVPELFIAEIRDDDTVVPPPETVLLFNHSSIQYFGGNPVLVIKALEYIFEHDLESEFEFKSLLVKLNNSNCQNGTYFVIGDIWKDNTILYYKLADKIQFHEKVFKIGKKVHLFQILLYRKRAIPADMPIIEVRREDETRFINSLKEHMLVCKVPENEMYRITSFIINKMKNLLKESSIKKKSSRR